MKHLKFFFKTVSALLPLWIIWLYTALFPVNYQNMTYTSFKWNKDFISTPQEEQYDVLFLGDSFINAVCVPELLSEKTVNLACSSCSPVEAYYILREYLKNHNAPSVCYLGFHNGIMNRDYCQDSYFLLHHLGMKEAFEIAGNAEYLMEHDQTAASNETFTAYYESIDVWSWMKKLLYFPSEYAVYLNNSSFFTRRADNLYWIGFASLHKGVWTARTASADKNHDAGEEMLEEYTVQPMMDLYFSMITELCRENDIILRVIDTPYPDGIKYTDTYKQQYLDYYQQYLDIYDKMTVAGFFGNLPLDCYGDGCHVNLHGAFEFSSMLREKYPEDFSVKGSEEVISKKTIKGFSDYLMRENSGEYILKWIQEKNFSVIVLFYEKPENSGFLDHLRTICGYDPDLPYFYVKGSLQSMESIEVSKIAGTEDGGDGQETDGMTFQLPWGGKYTVERISSEKYIPDMQIIMLNEYDNSVIGTKNFICNHGEYILMD